MMIFIILIFVFFALSMVCAVIYLFTDDDIWFKIGISMIALCIVLLVGLVVFTLTKYLPTIGL